MSHLKGQWQKEENNSSERSNYPHLCILMGGRGEQKCFSRKKMVPRRKWPVLIVDCYQLSSYRRTHLAAAQHQQSNKLVLEWLLMCNLIWNKTGY